MKFKSGDYIKMECDIGHIISRKGEYFEIWWEADQVVVKHHVSALEAHAEIVNYMKSPLWKVLHV